MLQTAVVSVQNPAHHHTLCLSVCCTPFAVHIYTLCARCPLCTVASTAVKRTKVEGKRLSHGKLLALNHATAEPEKARDCTTLRTQNLAQRESSSLEKQQITTLLHFNNTSMTPHRATYYAIYLTLIDQYLSSAHALPSAACNSAHPVM